MTEMNISRQAEQLKKAIIDNVAVNDDVVCDFCRELISCGEAEGDLQSVAFGYVWLADHYFYVASDMTEVSRALGMAGSYIDRNLPCELLEKYYTMRHLLDENSFDIRACFYHCLKALDVAEKANLEYRIGANYGNLGAFFLEYECYEESLMYSLRAARIMRSEGKPRILRLMLSNIISAYVKCGKFDLVLKMIDDLSRLPIEGNDLKLYVDYGYLLYYSRIGDKEKSGYYLQELFEDGLLQLSNRKYMIELLMNAIEAMMLIENQSKVKALLDCLKDFIKEDESEPQELWCKLNIRYAKQFGITEELEACYREYFRLHMKNQKQSEGLKIEGLRARIRLSEAEFETTKSRNEMQKLYNLANYDALTKVYNRRYLNVMRNEIINKEGNGKIGFAIFDIDYFKEYNDYYGHLAGDEALRQVAACLQKSAFPGMTVFRYGGDEFVCMVQGEACEKLDKYIRKAVRALEKKDIEHQLSKCANRITLSIGYGSRMVAGRVDLLNLFDEVDQALYAVKKEGRNNAKNIGAGAASYR